MILNFIQDVNLRGHSFEKSAKFLLRRSNKNNFIFCTSDFTDLKELLAKYRINFSKIDKNLIELINEEWTRFDILELKLNNVSERIWEDFIVYEVKTKTHLNKRLFSLCWSSNNFYNNLLELNQKVKLISIITFRDWRFSFNVHDINLKNFKIYSSTENKEK